MNAKSFLKVVIYVSTDYTYLVREILSDVGAGKTSEYEFYSFCTKGIRRSRSLKGPRAMLGQSDKVDHEEEERIETFIESSKKEELLEEIRQIQPFVHPIVDFYQVEYSTCLDDF